MSSLDKVTQEAAKFRAELKKLTHNELARQATDFYMRLILSYAEIDKLKAALTAQNKPSDEQKQGE
jgi:hypothetical protein